MLEIGAESAYFVRSNDDISVSNQLPVNNHNRVSIVGKIEAISNVLKSSSGGQCFDQCGQLSRFGFVVKVRCGSQILCVWFSGSQSLRFRYFLRIGRTFRLDGLKFVSVLFRRENQAQVLACTASTQITPVDALQASSFMAGSVRRVDCGVITLYCGVRMALHLCATWCRNGWALRPGSQVSVWLPFNRRSMHRANQNGIIFLPASSFFQQISLATTSENGAKPLQFQLSDTQCIGEVTCASHRMSLFYVEPIQRIGSDAFENRFGLRIRSCRSFYIIREIE